MAVSGLPEPCRCHARCIARLALDMMDLAADEVQIDGEPVVSPIFFYAFVLRPSIFMFAGRISSNDNIDPRGNIYHLSVTTLPPTISPKYF